MPIVHRCPVCLGRGYEVDGEGVITHDPCRTCLGSGEIFSSKLLTDILDKINDVMDKCIDIKQVVDEL